MEASFPELQQQCLNSSFEHSQQRGRYFAQQRPANDSYDYGFSEESNHSSSGKRASLMSRLPGPDTYAFNNSEYGGSSAVSGNYVMGPSGYGRPVYNQNIGIPRIDNDVSPYYGIENISDTAGNADDYSYEETKAVEEVHSNVRNVGAFEPGNPYGKWQPAQEDVEDIECLTRDAEIIAGVQPEQPPASDDAILKAMEIEVTVPSELMQADMCQLCQAQFSSPQMAESHYLGKKHAQRENQYVRKIYEEKGINVTRFLIKPEAKVAAVLAKKPVAVKKRFTLSCSLCNLGFENQNQVDLHVMGALHRKKVFDRQTQMLSASLGHEAFSSQEVGQLYCSLCDKALNSEQQFELHMQSKKHKSKEQPQSFYDY